MYLLGQQQDHASSPAKNCTPTDQLQRKPVGQWCLACNVEQPGDVGWQTEVVAVMRCRRSDGINPSSTVELGRACSYTSWHSACMQLAQVHQVSEARCAGAGQATVKLVCTTDHLSYYYHYHQYLYYYHHHHWALKLDPHRTSSHLTGRWSIYEKQSKNCTVLNIECSLFIDNYTSANQTESKRSTYSTENETIFTISLLFYSAFSDTMLYSPCNQMPQNLPSEIMTLHKFHCII